MNQSFESLYSEINIELQSKSYEKALELTSALFDSSMDDMQRLYAYLIKINILTVLGKTGELIATYSELIEMFNASKDEEVQHYVVSSYFYKAVTLGKNEQHKEAIETYDAMIEKFRKNQDESIVELVAKAMVNKASRLQDLENYEEAIEVLDEVVTKYEKVDSKVLLQVAIALHNKAAIYSKFGREKESEAICENIIKSFSHINDEMIHNIVASAQVIKDKEKFNNAF